MQALLPKYRLEFLCSRGDSDACILQAFILSSPRPSLGEQERITKALDVVKSICRNYTQYSTECTQLYSYLKLRAVSLRKQCDITISLIRICRSRTLFHMSCVLAPCFSYPVEQLLRTIGWVNTVESFYLSCFTGASWTPCKWLRSLCNAARKRGLFAQVKKFCPTNLSKRYDTSRSALKRRCCKTSSLIKMLEPRVNKKSR
jgi:hypothetical protein